ncbi:MAG: N-acetyltransferase [Phenylobacterium sp.]|nr:N-acetyltransferase [Phenylobacterium sp.]MDB5465126.1 N-acetyltransferase [Phenylobacterium sp.]
MNRSGLASANYELTPLSSADRADLFAHLSDARTVEHMDIEPLADLAGADAVIAWATGLAASGDGIRWAIRDRTGAFVGTAGFNALVRERGSRGEVAYDVVRPRWRQGVMAEVLPLVLGHGIRALGLHRIEAMVTPGNVASAALLERHGFAREAVLRDYAFWKGRYWDQWLYARLADDGG